MNAIFNFHNWMPVFVQVIQLLIFISVAVFLLRKTGIIRYPLNGLEYSQVVFAGVIVFSVLLISTSGTSAMFQMFKTYQAEQPIPRQLYFEKCGQYFLVTLLFELFLGLPLLLFASKALFSGNLIKEILAGSIPSALLAGSIILGLAIGLRVMSAEVMEFITPHYLNFR